MTVHTSSGPPTSSAAILGELVGEGRVAARPRVLYGRALGGRTTQFGAAGVSDFLLRGDGLLVAVGEFTGRLETEGERVVYRQRMVACHPGPVGEEVSLPPACVEPVDEPAAFLVAWRPAP